jgi:hypothetical protein
VLTNCVLSVFTQFIGLGEKERKIKVNQTAKVRQGAIKREKDKRRTHRNR